MKLRHWLLLGLLAAGAAGIWYLTREEPLELTVGVVERGSVEQAVSNTRAGTVKACRRARLSPSTGGQISYLGVTEGDPVKVGDLLVELWNEDLKAELSLAGSERETARAKATAACLNAEVDQREADRLTRLQERRAASDEEVDKAVTQAKAARADCLAAHAAVEESSNRVAVKQATLARTRLVAPFAGVIAEVNGEVNEYVTPSPPGIATLPVIDLIDNSCFYVSAPIDEVDVARVEAGLVARISLDACGDKEFSGKVRRVAPYVLDLEKQARTVDVEVEFDSPETVGTMLAGYSADVEIILDVHADTLRIPTESVVADDRVYVLDDSAGLLERRTIEAGIANWDFTEVLSGLREGESVVTSVDRDGVEDGARAVAEGDAGE